jgi:beta-glucosidase/6-phospho-beta-glucosidase/beta-galactosidase
MNERHAGAPGQVKEVTSLANPLIKDIKALAQKKFRDQQNAFMAEGLKLVIDCAHGAAYNIAPDKRGHVHDAKRVVWLQKHLRALSRAIDDGVPVRAYHCWSLLDNFEWAEGYTQRFGLVHVDFERGQKRTVKDSGEWYAKMIAANRVI